jgi:hypothetical protein
MCRDRFWKWVEGDLSELTGMDPLDAAIVASDRLRQRTGRLCIWMAVAVGTGSAVVLAPHCYHLMVNPTWGDAKPAWLVVSAPSVALIAALLGLAERFLTPARLLRPVAEAEPESAFKDAMVGSASAVEALAGKIDPTR